MSSNGIFAEQELNQLRSAYSGLKYIPLRIFIQIIDLESKLKKQKTK